MPDTFVKIASVTVGAGGSSSIDFTSIPSTYTDLCIKLSIRTNNNAVFDSAKINFNADTGSNYSRLYLVAEGTAFNNFSATGNAAYFPSYSLSAANATASTFSNSEFYIPNYAGSNQKSISMDATAETNAATAYLGIHAGRWTGTAAINQITIAPSSGTLFNQYSTATLYGIKNS